MNYQDLHPGCPASLLSGIAAQISAEATELPAATSPKGKIVRVLLKKLATEHGLVASALTDAQLLALWRTGAYVGDAGTPAPAPTPDPRHENNGNGGTPEADLAAALRKLVGPGSLDESRVLALIAENLPDVSTERLTALIEETVKPTTTHVIIDDKVAGKIRDLGEKALHPCFERVLRVLTNHETLSDDKPLNAYCWGPAGAGKTTLAKQIAEALGVTLYYTGKVEHVHSLVGFINVTGYQRTPFRDAWEHGGVFLFDELDRSNPAAVVALNAELDGHEAAFPDGMIRRHPKFYAIATGNTALRGATKEYRAAQAQDFAAIDRWVKIELPVDEKLEHAITLSRAWTKRVQEYRKTVAKLEALQGVMVTPRASINGGKLLATGFTLAEVEEMTLFSGLDAATITKIREAAGTAPDDTL